MHKLFRKVDRLRASGYATLELQADHPLFHLTGRKFRVAHMESPDIKSKIALFVENQEISFTLDQVT